MPGIDRDQQREPDLPGRGVRGSTLVRAPSHGLGFNPTHPQIDRGTRPLQHVTATALLPALIGECNDLEARLIAVGLAVIEADGRLVWPRHEWSLPELCDGLVVKVIMPRGPDNPGPFARPKALVEDFEARQFLHDRVGDRLAPAWPDECCGLGKASQRTLWPKAAGEVTHRCRMGVRCLGSRRRRAVFHEDHGTHQVIAPRDMIDTAALAWANIGPGIHQRGVPRWPTIGGGSQRGERVRGLPRVSPHVASRSSGVLKWGGKPSAAIVAECGEGHQGEAAAIATAKPSPEVSDGGTSPHPRSDVYGTSRTGEGSGR